ncbi:hypothetical protein IP88_08725 [alpha proteobacterium AAP81b]|nr:hypothetical protein IP88_08725 [alpha proteobacterium AAP81b]
MRRVSAAGGFATILARGDATAGSIAIVTRDSGGDERLLAPVMALAGGHDWVELAAGEAIPAWIERARGRDPDLWVVELDIPDAARFVAETLGPD